MKKQIFCASIVFVLFASCATQKQKDLFKIYSATAVPEEGGINFVRITEPHDNVASGGVKRSNSVYTVGNKNVRKEELRWWVNPMIAISKDGSKLAYLANRNSTTNIMVKNSSAGGASIQRTFRTLVEDLSWSPDGTTLCFTEYRNERHGIYLVNAEQGSVVRQISNSNDNDFGGVMSADGNTIYFHRSDGNGNYTLWSFDRKTNLFSSYSNGITPCLVPDMPNTVYCARRPETGNDEIWRINLETGVEEIILSRDGYSFSTPQLSPDGRWLLVTGTSISEKTNTTNLDIFVVRTDGTDFTQLTYHPGHDFSAVWSPDGNAIYFLSQRGSLKQGQKADNALFNVWKMNFNL